MNRLARTASVAVATLVLVLTGACGDDDDDGSTAGTPTADDTAAEDSAAPAAGGSVATADAGDLGTILVNEDGFTLYMFDNDTTTPPTSNCYDQCATNWPPVPATTDAEGVDAALLGSATRTDGEEQLTINNYPVYLFMGDQAAGDTNGQASNGVW